MSQTILAPYKRPGSSYDSGRALKLRRNSYNTSTPIYQSSNKKSTKPSSSTTMKSGFSNNTYRDKWAITSARTNPVYPRPEVKFFDLPLGTLPPASPSRAFFAIPLVPAVFSLFALAQGSGSMNRIGQQVAVKSVYYQYQVQIGAIEVPTVCRILLFWDRTPNGSPPSASAVISDTANGVVSPMNLANRDRFVILADERLTLSPQGDTSKIVEGYRKINQYCGFPDVSDQSQPLTGGVFILLCSDENVTSNNPELVGTWRTRYVDN